MYLYLNSLFTDMNYVGDTRLILQVIKSTKVCGSADSCLWVDFLVFAPFFFSPPTGVTAHRSTCSPTHVI